jgi:peptidylprolyl isomerase
MKYIISFFLFCLCIFNFSGESAQFEMPIDPIAVIQTNQGDIEVRLFPAIAPKAVENFIRLAESGYYNNTTFHRIIKGFMIQGGDPTGTGSGGESIWGKPFENEINNVIKFDKPGYLAMANRGPDTNGSQFFITTAKAPWLDGEYTIFGEVIAGEQVVSAIENSKSWINFWSTEPQVIQRIYLKR